MVRCRMMILLPVLAASLASAAPAGSAEPYRFVDAVAEVYKGGAVDVFARTNRPLPREDEPEDDEVGRTALGWFTLARRSPLSSSGVFRTGLPRRNCYWQTKEYKRLPPELRPSQIGKRVRLTFRFEDGRKPIVGTALLVKPGQNSPRRLGCRK